MERAAHAWVISYIGTCRVTSARRPERVGWQGGHALLQGGQRQRKQLRARPRRHALQRQSRLAPALRACACRSVLAAARQRLPTRAPFPAQHALAGRRVRVPRRASRGCRGGPGRIQSTPCSRPDLPRQRTCMCQGCRCQHPTMHLHVGPVGPCGGACGAGRASGEYARRTCSAAPSSTE